MSLTYEQARAEALAAGATDAEIAAEAKIQARNVGTVPFRNMIRALQLLPRLNSAEDWARLAAALKARKEARK
jgi:uncharacterized circularly permuted ATP-grasp superfamily protein